MEDRKVRVLLEDINHKFNTISEALSDISPMKEDVEVIKKDISQLKEDMAIVKLLFPQKAEVSEIEKINKKINILQTKIAH